jgi:hypothetical protein
MMRRAWKLGLLQLVGNALLLWLGYTWLGIGESNGSMLALSGALVLALVAGVALLQGVSLAYFRAQDDRLRRTLGNVVRRVVPLIIVGIVAALLYLGLWLWDPKPLVLWIASGLTYLTQSPVRPAWILRVVEYVLMVVRWGVLPVFLVPLASGIATRGWQGWREYRTQLRNWRYWLIVPAALIVGVWLPLWMVAWTPVKGSFTSEMVSFLARYSVAYLLFVAAALVLAFATSRGRPVVTQESTTASL